jgi:exodeoxyribonuclease V gamma subunit
LGHWLLPILNVLKPEGIEPESTFVALDQTLTLGPVESPEALLADLLELRWLGLCRPLPFFPESALAFVERDGYGSAFENAWAGRYNPTPEQGLVSVRIAFRGRDPFDKEFDETARRILVPMLEHSSSLKAARDLS